MAQLAIYALAAMASETVLYLVQDRVRTGESANFFQQIATELKELKNSWEAQSKPHCLRPVAPEVLDLLNRALVVLFG